MFNKLLPLLLFLVWFSIAHFSTPYLIGNDDSYWHIRYTQVMVNDWDGTREFFLQPVPYAGFLFHLYLAPFTFLPDLILASKLSAIILASLVMFMLYRVIQSQNYRFPLIWSFGLLIFVANFSYRLLLNRTFLVSLFFLLLVIYSLFNKKNKLLFFASLGYGLSYLAAPIAFIITLLWQIINYFKKSSFDRVPIYLSLLGVILGFMLNPAFPEFLVHAEKIANLFYSVPTELTGLSSELTSFTVKDFIQTEGLLFAVWLMSLGLSIRLFYKKQANPTIIFLLLLSVPLWFLSMQARRFIEYWAPMAMLLSASIFSTYLNKIDLGRVKRLLKTDWQFVTAVLILGAIILSIAFSNLNLVYSWVKNNPEPSMIEPSAKWLAQNSKTQDGVFNIHWSDYHKLYFWSPYNTYATKFDPTHLYSEDQYLYWQWRKISDDDRVGSLSIEEIHNILSKDFNAKFLFIDKSRNPNLLHKIVNEDQSHLYFSWGHEDDLAIVFKVN